MTAVPVARTWKFWGSRCRFFSVPSTIPWSDRMNCQARRPDHERDEEREEQHQQEEVLVRPAVERDPVRERVGDDEVDRGGEPRVAERAEELRVVRRKTLRELGEVPR